MCGVAGIASNRSGSQAMVEIVARMTDAIRHRGPDGHGVRVASDANPAVVLGHTRLAIIDVSAAGAQPMVDPETNNVISFNGEIYNYRELREELRAQGCEFRSNSDTEVLLRAHAVWGDDAVSRLNGIFAYALWDARSQRLLLARDHLGVKPLYYSILDGRILFASEVRAILASGLVERRADPEGIRSFLAYGSVQDPLTMVQSVRSVPAGSLAVWRDGALRQSSYWRIPAPPRGGAESAPREKDLAEMRHALESAVTSQLVSDVPLGAFLSGGIDSTAITALMKQGVGEVRTFSIVFEEDQFDESQYSRLAARSLGTDHVELRLRPTDVRVALPAAMSAVDQPSVDGLNTYFVSGLTKQAGLTVAMSGLGGDELFGGYDAYHHIRRAAAWQRRLHVTPRSFRPAAATAMRAIGSAPLRRAADLMVADHSYDVARQLFSDADSNDLLEPSVAHGGAGWSRNRQAELYQHTGDMDPVSRASALEMLTYMRSTLLRDTDQMSMAHALEVRVPLIDKTLVERVFALPGHWRLDARIPKPLLTTPLMGSIPPECIFRPKRGFELPLRVWLRDALRPEMEARFLGQTPASAWPFTPIALQRSWAAFESGRMSWSRVWALFTLRHWLGQHRLAA